MASFRCQSFVPQLPILGGWLYPGYEGNLQALPAHSDQIEL